MAHVDEEVLEVLDEVVQVARGDQLLLRFVEAVARHLEDVVRHEASGAVALYRTQFGCGGRRRDCRVASSRCAAATAAAAQICGDARDQFPELLLHLVGCCREALFVHLIHENNVVLRRPLRQRRRCPNAVQSTMRLLKNSEYISVREVNSLCISS